MIPTKIVFFNGPPRSGKDTAAKAIYSDREQFNAKHYAFKWPIDRALRALFQWEHKHEVSFEQIKNEKLDYFNDHSLREMKIAFSEQYVKPMLGIDAFGRLALLELQKPSAAEIICISDSGFRPEAEILVDYYKPRNCLLVRLHREGCDFSNDSRSHIDLADMGVTCVDVNNYYDDVTLFELKIKKVVKEWLATRR